MTAPQWIRHRGARGASAPPYFETGRAQPPSDLNDASHCVCSHPFSIGYALTCPTGGYPSIKHNALRYFTAKIMSEVCYDVPHLQPLTGESLTHATANTADAVCLDISALGF